MHTIQILQHEGKIWNMGHSARTRSYYYYSIVVDIIHDIRALLQPHPKPFCTRYIFMLHTHTTLSIHHSHHTSEEKKYLVDRGQCDLQLCEYEKKMQSCSNIFPSKINIMVIWNMKVLNLRVYRIFTQKCIIQWEVLLSSHASAPFSFLHTLKNQS